jgi:hypothetical protein
MTQFDPNIPGFIQGEVTRVTVLDPRPVGNHVLDPTKPFDVEIEWNVSGPLAPLWLFALGGNWDVSVYSESIGAGQEARLGTNNTVAADPNRLNYSATVTVPAGSLAEHTPGTNFGGIYKLAVAVFLDSSLPGGFDMIGFAEGPTIQSENPE